MFTCLSARAADYPYTFTKVGPEYRLTLEQNSAVYFGFQYSPNLVVPFATAKMALGTPGPVFAYTPLPAELEGFFRVNGISVYAPEDSDHDGMDDIWELQHGLNPLDASDAAAPSARMPGLTNLEEYRLRFGLGNQKPQYYSREVSLFNYGANRTEAVSREVSLFNFGAQWSSVEALSREISVFNGEAPPIAGYPQIYSREVSLFNFGAQWSSVEALSREVTVFNGEAPPIAGYPQIYSREVSVFNFGSPIHSVEAISREVSVFNNIPN